MMLKGSSTENRQVENRQQAKHAVLSLGYYEMQLAQLDSEASSLQSITRDRDTHTHVRWPQHGP